MRVTLHIFLLDIQSNLLNTYVQDISVLTALSKICICFSTEILAFASWAPSLHNKGITIPSVPTGLVLYGALMLSLYQEVDLPLICQKNIKLPSSLYESQGRKQISLSSYLTPR